MNNKEREQWIRNTEDLYTLFRLTRLSMSNFIRTYRDVIDSTINYTIDLDKRFEMEKRHE